MGKGKDVSWGLRRRPGRPAPQAVCTAGRPSRGGGLDLVHDQDVRAAQQARAVLGEARDQDAARLLPPASGAPEEEPDLRYTVERAAAQHP